MCVWELRVFKVLLGEHRASHSRRAGAGADAGACARALQQVSTSATETGGLAPVRARSRPPPSPRRCHSPHQPLQPSSASAGESGATSRLRSGSQGGDPFKRENGIPGDPLRENSPRSRSPAGPAAVGPLPAPRGRPRGAGARGERASVETRAGAPAPRRRSPPRPAAPARRPPLPPGARPSVRRAGRPVPQPRGPGAHAARGRGGGGGGGGGGRAGCTHHSRPSSPARSAGADGADAGLGFHINSFFPLAPLSWSSAPPSSPRLPWTPPSLVAAGLFVFPVVVFFFVLVFVFSSSSSVFTKGTESVKTPARWAAGGFRRSAARTHNYKPVSIKQFHGPRRGWSAAP